LQKYSRNIQSSLHRLVQKGHRHSSENSYNTISKKNLFFSIKEYFL